MKVKLPVTYEVCGIIEVEADSVESAVKLFEETSDDIPLPYNAEYVDGSFRLSCSDIDDIKDLTMD